MQLDNAIDVYRRVVDVADAGSLVLTPGGYEVSVPFARGDRVLIEKINEIKDAATLDGTESHLCVMHEGVLVIS